jgi:hypothetical protein
MCLLQLRVKAMGAKVRYPETDEEEDINLEELINEKQLAVSKYQRIHSRQGYTAVAAVS